MAEEGLEPNLSANPATLLRRLSLDLTGIPPTVAEVDAFLADPSEANYQAQIERLLASPHFGEKWAIRWLDPGRYAHSNVYQRDDLLPSFRGINSLPRPRVTGSDFCVDMGDVRMCLRFLCC